MAELFEEKILAWPSKPPLNLDKSLQELKKYESISKVPLNIITEITEILSECTVLAVWGRKGYGFGQEIMYSIENLEEAKLTHEINKKDYRACNPRLMKYYSQKDLENLITTNQ